jgi:putative peptide zinc metalloprotease protein
MEGKSRKPVVLAVVAALVVGLAGWAMAEDVPLFSTATSDTTTTTALGVTAGGGDNVAAAVNTHDGKTVIALAIKITQIADETVDPVNAAVAVASCTDCQTVAIALEGVLVIGEPDTFTPTNIALAINTGCSNCQTLASAYQTVVQNDTRVRITGEGRREIAAIRQELNMLRTSDLDITVIRQKVNEAAARFTRVLQTQVIPIGRPAPTTTPSSTSTTSTTAPSGGEATSTTSTTEPPATTSTTAATTSTTAAP